MSIPLRSPALGVVMAGALAACGFAPLDLWPLALVAIAGWMALIHAAPTMKSALWLGWLFGVAHFTVANNWIQHAFDFQDKMPPVLGYAAPFALALYLAVYPAAAAGLAWRYGRRGARDVPYVLVFAAAWIATEWLRATMFTGYAWDPLGVMWLPVKSVAMLAADIGTYAMSGLAIVAAGALLLLVRRRWHLGAALVVLLAIQLVRGGLEPTPVAPGPLAPRVRIVQPNIPQQDRGTEDGERMFTRLAALSGRPGPAPRLVLWPEGVLRDLVESGYPSWVCRWPGRSAEQARARIARLIGPNDVLMTGGDSLNFNSNAEIVSAANAVYAIDARARIVARYDKAHLVPYGEYLPMPWLLRPLGLSRLVPGDLDFIPGPGPRALPFPAFGPVGVQICYEIIFSGEVVNRAARPRLMFNPSNDAWFGTWGPPQHLAQARMRAIEEGIPIVRATPTGISAIIGADGTLLATVPHEQAGAVELPIPPARPAPLFARVGNAMAALVAAALLLAGVAIRRRRR